MYEQMNSRGTTRDSHATPLVTSLHCDNRPFTSTFSVLLSYPCKKLQFSPHSSSLSLWASLKSKQLKNKTWSPSSICLQVYEALFCLQKFILPLSHYLIFIQASTMSAPWYTCVLQTAGLLLCSSQILPGIPLKLPCIYHFQLLTAHLTVI